MVNLVAEEKEPTPPWAKALAFLTLLALFVAFVLPLAIGLSINLWEWAI